MTQTEARQALEREITKQLGQPGSPTRIMNDGSVTFAWFVTNRSLPLKEAVWKEETAKTKKILIQLNLVESLGEIPLANFDNFSLQLHLNELATTASKDRVLQIRAYLRDILPRQSIRTSWPRTLLANSRYLHNCDPRTQQHSLGINLGWPSRSSRFEIQPAQWLTVGAGL